MRVGVRVVQCADVQVKERGAPGQTTLAKTGDERQAKRGDGAIERFGFFDERLQLIGVRLIEVQTEEMLNAAFRLNDANRCYHCKTELFTKLRPLADSLGIAHLAYGINADDVGDHRPGHGSAVRRGVRFPLLEAGMGKGEIRAAARRLGLPNWDKPSFACLSSRIPHGTEVTPDALRQVGAAEAALKRLGFRQVRVRHHGEVARLEVEPAELERALALRERVVAGVREAGYTFVALDLEGYATGSLNRTWRPSSGMRTPAASG